MVPVSYVSIIVGQFKPWDTGQQTFSTQLTMASLKDCVFILLFLLCQRKSRRSQLFVVGKSVLPNLLRGISFFIFSVSTTESKKINALKMTLEGKYCSAATYCRECLLICFLLYFRDEFQKTLV